MMLRVYIPTMVNIIVCIVNTITVVITIHLLRLSCTCPGLLMNTAGTYMQRNCNVLTWLHAPFSLLAPYYQGFSSNSSSST